jgi:MoCo/4Fe-4S cofactor protein with predicted Tat translocation signal
MKRVFNHGEKPLTGKKYWRSLGELEDTPEFRQWLEREFPAGASELRLDPVSRRNFLKLMGASTALAGLGLSACRRPLKHLVPFTNGVEWAIPGKPLFFATSMPDWRGAIPLVVTTYDGRPTKIEGNPLHPLTQGRTDTWAQSSVLDLYDPDRARFFLNRGKKSSVEEFEKQLDLLLKNAGTDGGSVAVLAEHSNSPTRERLRRAVEAKLPGILWAEYEPLAGEQASARIRGSDIQTADVIVSLDADFLGCEEGSIELTRAFAARRRVNKPGDKMNRLYAVENRYTITGGMADHRLRCPASQIPVIAAALARAVGAGAAAQAESVMAVATPKFSEEWITALGKDLVAHRGRVLVIAGARQPRVVHETVRAINAALGAASGAAMSAGAPAATIVELATAITDQRIRTLFVLGGNPAYNAPADLDWARLQGSVQTVVRLGFHVDETSEHAHWHVPATHYLESWGDARASDGTYLSVQPMILPLYGGWSELDLLARMAGLPKPAGPELVQQTFRELANPGNFDAAWNKFLHDGFTLDVAPPPTAPMPAGTMNATAAAAEEETAGTQAPMPVLGGTDAFEVVFVADSKVYDGRYTNNGWMQEAPDPVTKLTWDNAALISPKSARDLGLKTSDVITISLDEKRRVEAPVLIAPGHADQSITLSLGYGRTAALRVGQGIGFNAYPLRTTSQPYVAGPAKIEKTGRSYPLAVTQEHSSMEGRAIVREGTLEKFQSDPGFAKTMGMDAHIPGNVSLYSNPPLDGLHQWGMAIDLNTCTGCNACVIACQAENNIPIVGKDQVISGREMHWLRMDRYFTSVGEEDEEPEMVTQPMLCQHCENAPCEPVCPVNATVHNNEGLNVMTYNRCIGTRYCANNCPFKVRRFNFFDYNQRPIGKTKVAGIEADGLYLGPLTEKGAPPTIKMQKNINVTVRMRGVMEKCTFCVQRIQEAKIGQKVRAGASDDVKIPTDAFQVACQQACASDSIVFGDISDPKSRVSQLKAQEKNYRLLEYLNVKTRVSYLARLRNPNMEMPGAEKIGQPEGGHDHHGGHETPHAGGHGS